MKEFLVKELLKIKEFMSIEVFKMKRFIVKTHDNVTQSELQDLLPSMHVEEYE